MLRRLHVENFRCYAVIAHGADFATVEARCAAGFAPLAAELRARAR